MLPFLPQSTPAGRAEPLRQSEPDFYALAYRDVLSGLTPEQRETYDRGMWTWWSYAGAAAVDYVERRTELRAEELRGTWRAGRREGYSSRPRQPF